MMEYANAKGKLRTLIYDKATGDTIQQESELLFQNELSLDKQIESNVIGVYPSFTYQTFEGYGCAMTESACWLLSRMFPEDRKSALKAWFSPEGMNARFIRAHIDSCDYSLDEYQSVTDPIVDPDLNSFNIDRDRKWVIPAIKEALALSENTLSVLLSPWSPPYQWKTPPESRKNESGVYGGTEPSIDSAEPSRCFGGRLKPEFYGSWANYLVRFIQAYLAEGIPVTMLSIQNEANAATPWDSCVWSAEEEKRFLRFYLYPAMKDAGLTEKIGIYIWDHNKERMIERIDSMMCDDIYDMVEGFAYHWYSGDHFDALGMLHEKYPDKTLMHSESCALHIPGKSTSYDPLAQMPAKWRKIIAAKDISEFNQADLTACLQELMGMFRSKYPDKVQSIDLSHGITPEMFESIRRYFVIEDPKIVDFRDAKAYAHDIIGDINHGMQRFIDWNLIVDRMGGPRHVEGGFAAPIIYEEDGSFTKTVSYEFLNHIAHTIRSGAVRLGNTVFSTTVEATAVKNQDGNISVLLLNPMDYEQHVNIRICGLVARIVLAPEALCSVELRCDEIITLN